jgi:hypothetical protein
MYVCTVVVWWCGAVVGKGMMLRRAWWTVRFGSDEEDAEGRSDEGTASGWSLAAVVGEAHVGIAGGLGRWYGLGMCRKRWQNGCRSLFGQEQVRDVVRRGDFAPPAHVRSPAGEYIQFPTKEKTMRKSMECNDHHGLRTYAD